MEDSPFSRKQGCPYFLFFEIKAGLIQNPGQHFLVQQKNVVPGTLVVSGGKSFLHKQGWVSVSYLERSLALRYIQDNKRRNQTLRDTCRETSNAIVSMRLFLSLLRHLTEI